MVEWRIEPTAYRQCQKDTKWAIEALTDIKLLFCFHANVKFEIEIYSLNNTLHGNKCTG